MLTSLAAQLGLNESSVACFHWTGRTAERFRQEIRAFLDYKEPTETNNEQFIRCLIDEILPLAPTLPQCREHAFQFYRKHRLESPSEKQLDSNIRSAMRQFEKQFFSGIVAELSSDTVNSFEKLLIDDSDEPDEEKAETENAAAIPAKPSESSTLSIQKTGVRELSGEGSRLDAAQAVISAGISENTEIRLNYFKKDMAGVKLKHVKAEIEKLLCIRNISLPEAVFSRASRKLIQKYYTRIMAAFPGNIREYIPEARYASMASFCYIRSQILTDNLADLFIQLIQKMKASAEIRVKKQIISEVKRVDGKFDILYSLAETAKDHPQGIIKDEIYPKVSPETLDEVVKDLQHRGKWYQKQVNTKVRSLYSHAHRKVLLALLNAFTFHSNSLEGKALLAAIVFIKEHQDETDLYYPEDIAVPTKNVVSAEWQSMVMEPIIPIESSVVSLIKSPAEKTGHESASESAGSPLDKKPETNLVAGSGDLSEEDSDSKTERFRINRFNYEVAVLETLRSQLRCKSIWIAGAYRYRDPDEDLPKDWESRREYYYGLLGLPLDANDFIKTLKGSLSKSLKEFNDTIPNNDKVTILKKNNGHIRLSPSEAQAKPTQKDVLQKEINRRWSTINLIDILKEADSRIGFTKQFQTVASREVLDPDQLRKRLLLCLYAIGSNTGLKRISAANADVSYSDLRYVKRRYLNETNVRAAIVDVVNEILAIRDPKIWGEATVGCACDSTQVSSWDQNLMSEWHPRYHECGVMIYWHVDRNSTCIYSQLKTPLSSEVGAMIMGVLKHDTKMNMDKTYMDTHGQSTIGFGFGRCLSFDLLPRIKRIHKQKLYYPTPKDKDSYPHLTPILQKAIKWDTIENNYDEVVKHAVAVKIGLVEPDVLIKRFSKDNYTHPVYKALTEIGNVGKTNFLCRYLSSEALRIEIHEMLNIVERLNGVMGFIFYGKLGEISTNRRDDQSLSVACLHLLQVCMVYINTLIIQEVLSDEALMNKLTAEDKRAITPLIHAHINPYGLFPLDLNEALIIKGKLP